MEIGHLVDIQRPTNNALEYFNSFV